MLVKSASEARCSSFTNAMIGIGAGMRSTVPRLPSLSSRANCAGADFCKKLARLAATPPAFAATAQKASSKGLAHLPSRTARRCQYSSALAAVNSAARARPSGPIRCIVREKPRAHATFPQAAHSSQAHMETQGVRKKEKNCRTRKQSSAARECLE